MEKKVCIGIKNEMKMCIREMCLERKNEIKKNIRETVQKERRN